MKKLTKYLAFLGLSVIGLIYYFYPAQYPKYVRSDHYNPEKQSFFNLIPGKKVDKGEVLSALWKMIFHKHKFMPSEQLPTQKPNFSVFLDDTEQANFIWFGHSSLLARMGGKTIFIDPVFAQSVSPLPIMMQRFQSPPANLVELPPIDWIVISHNHYDHLDRDVIEYYKLQKTSFIVPLGVGVLLQKWGIGPERIRELDWWQSTNLGVLEISAVPARHNTGRGLFDSNKTLWTGYVFKTSSEQFYYSGDSSFGDGIHFQQIAQRFGNFDIAFIENGQYNQTWIDNHMMPEQTAKVAKIIQPTRFMPIHWGAYALSIHGWKEPVERSVPLVKEYGIETLTPLLGEVFNRQTQTLLWWQDIK
ncbi:multidrug transporter [Vespertiliibacter pulmonis]|uniref:L-ascorbate metabolism protein UlaG (Beta-lactamase superfamily) n=1 Tax=Vespertiliibacter pulmonis TaxID=1443036 RepID=A0A3N4VLT3_9PAST|nr:MBL fold metallo-hydrolase [Vespertiliibacter pulmonis]QLB21063.1 multidrug transporter [Vespertiliibacter pulmonis]RPE83838.1 L-ascorbate metabolism protein UlaG (beta-lactamase superfamily) [Vespertiliibacter pulmonis]